MGQNFSDFNASCHAASLNYTSGGTPYAGDTPSSFRFPASGDAGEDEGHYNDTAFASMSTQTRLYGMLYSTILVKVLLAWVCQKALVVLNLIPARLLLVVIPINTVVLLLMIALSLSSEGAGNSMNVSLRRVAAHGVWIA